MKTPQPIVADGPFLPSFESLEASRVPDWYIDGKFGIFIHWGLYAVPAVTNEWYAHAMYTQDSPEYQSHLKNFGPHTKFGYKDFIPLFRAEKYDPAAWATLFQQAGAKFVVPVAEHHDGFPMYDCSRTEWSAAKMGPKRDLIGDLAAAVKKRGLVFGLSSHRAEHWWFYDGGRKFPSDVQDPKFDGLYGPAQPKTTQPDAAFLDDWLLRTAELVDKYQPQLVWFDWWIEEPAFKPYLPRFVAYYYNRGAEWGKGVAINYKKQAMPAKAAVFDIERGQAPGILPQFWQTDTSVSKNSWGYVSNHQYKAAGSIVDDLIDIVSKNGALLLNIGPRPDGTIPEPEEAMLLEIGAWLGVNGEAIYGSRPWVVFGEGPTEVVAGTFADTKRKEFTGQDFRFTTKGDTLYAIALDWPGDEAVVTSLAPAAGLAGGKVTEVTLLGHAGQLAFTQDARGLVVKLPTKKPCEHAFVLKIAGLKIVGFKPASLPPAPKPAAKEE